MITTKNEEFWIENDNLLPSKNNFIINSSRNQLQTTTVEPQHSTLIFDTTHSIFCHSNDIPFIPNSLLIQSQLNITYDVGTRLFYTCQPGYESLFNQTSFTICSMNGTWSIDTINITMCQLSKLEEIIINY